MTYQLLADITLVVHGLFILFAVTGGLLAIRWPRVAWVHLPAVIWAAFIEFSGGICPLTPMENHYRELAGETAYSGGYIEHYLLPLIYPAGLTRNIQFWLGAGVLLVNVVAYTFVARHTLQSRKSEGN